MKLTTVIPDGTVCKDNACYSGLVWVGTPLNIHALQWNDADPINVNDVIYYGWLEYNDGTPNEYVKNLPAWAKNAEEAWVVANTPVPPTPEQIQAMNKSEAVLKLQNTDWAATVDINNPTYSDPYLGNQDEFLSYRSEIRQIAINPPTTPVVIWPVEPTAVWKAAP